MTDDSEKTNGANGNGGVGGEGQSAPQGAEARVAELEAQVAALRDQALRALADADNTRKRAEREAALAREYAIEKFATDLLAVADNLSRALSAVPDSERAGASDAMRNLLAGIELTERELMKAFERHKISVIDPKGQPFDPNLHQAVAQFPSDVPAGRVAEVMQTGFRLGDRVLRAAMVAVSTGPAQQAPKPGGYGEAPEAPKTDFKV